MKKIFLLTAIISLALASCQSEDSLEQNQSEIQLTSVIESMSRGTLLTQQSTQIVSGQEIGVTINDAKEPHNNVKWTAGADGQLTNSGTPLYWSNKEVSIYAYHPYSSTWNGKFSVNTDQSTDAGYLNSDLLWATATATKTAAPIALTFTHKLAKINVTLKSDDITDLSNATINICNTNISTQFNTLTGELRTATVNVQDIKAGVTTSTAYTASAIIVPQELASGTKFIKVTHNNKNFYYTLAADKELKSGYSYSYTLNVKESQVEVDVESDNITDWTDEEATGDAEEVDLSWFNPNQYISYVANHETVSNIGDRDYFYHCRSYINWPSVTFSKIECKFQINTPPTYWNDDIVVCGPIYFNDTAHILSGDYSWDELSAQLTDCMILNISLKDKCIKLNGNDLEYKTSMNSYSTYGLIFSDYYRDYDEGEYKDWSGVPEGSKLYYIKLWNENDELIYLGAASTALNPTTNKIENCWCSYYNGIISFQFAYNSETLTNYQPYGGGTDE